MAKMKNTKRALLGSVISMMLCVAMLIGSTFAWFTDTATTSVNKIQSGKLDVVLEMKDKNGEWVSAEGKTLDFIYEGENVNKLWEPGCTYKLPDLKFTNNGNLKLKYQLVITGIKGNAELNKVIDWTITHDNETTPLVNGDGTYKEFAMEPQETIRLTISGKMRETAGNEYQNRTIDGISITIYATQLGGELNGVNGEYDSNGNTYDEDAEYPMHFEPTLNDEAMTKTSDGYTYTNSTGSVVANTKAVANNEAAVPGMKLEKVDATNTGDASITANQDSFAYDIEISNLKTNEDGKIVDKEGKVTTATISFTTEANLDGVVLYHDGVAMTKATAAGDVDNANEFHYDETTGVVTICVDHFSNFTVVYDEPVAYNQLETLYTSVQDAMEDDASTEITMSADSDLKNVVNIDEGRTLTLNMNGKTLNLTGPAVIDVSGNLTVTGNGKMTQDEESTIGYLFRAKDNAVLTIKNGSYDAGLTCVQLTDSATANIESGDFSAWSKYQEKYWLLNTIDSAVKTVTWNVTGGTFKGFNPAQGGTENPEMSFVGKNYESKPSSDGNYVVVKSRVWEDEQGNKHINVESMTDLHTALEQAAVAEQNDLYIDLTKSFDMSDWTVHQVSSSSKNIILDGKGFTLSNMREPLFVGTAGGHNSITIKNLTIENANIIKDGYNNLGVGAFIAYLDGSGGIEMKDCHLKSSTITGTSTAGADGMAGGLVGYSSAANVSFSNCTVEDSYITGYGNAAGLIGYSSSKTTINDCKVNDNTIRCSETGKNWRIGAIIGTFQGKEGSAFTNCTYLNNQFIQDGWNESYFGNNFDSKVNEAYGRNFYGNDAATAEKNYLTITNSN